MVGRLVEQQDIGRGRQHARQRRAARLAAGEMRRVFVAVRGRAAPADSGPDSGRRRGRGRPRHRPAWSRSRRNPAPAADSGRWRRAARSGCRCRARPAPAAIFSSVDLPEPLRPTRQTRSPAETDSSTPVSSGVPPKVSAMSLSWISGGAISSQFSCFLILARVDSRAGAGCGGWSGRARTGTPSGRAARTILARR